MQRGWVPFLNMHLRDYLLTDNGAFVEVVRASAASGSRIIGPAHLDSARCTRTADPTCRSCTATGSARSTRCAGGRC